PDGNYIEFYWISYHRDNRIHEIKYTGNTVTGQAPYNVMKFHYKFRNDQNTIYQAGSNIRSRFLLDRVEIEAEGSTFKTYELRYSYDNYRSTLHSIKEKGSDGSEMNNTIFKYGDQPLNAETRTLPTFLNQNMDLFSGDFDGDGYTDILGSPYTYLNGVKFNTGLKVYKRTHVNDNYFLSFQQSLPSESTVVNGLNIPKFHNFISSDFNGDGRDDIMTTKVEISGLLNTRRLVHLTLYKSTGNGFSTSIYTPPVGFNGVYPNYRYFFPGDFNGDGKTDFILFLSDGTGFLPFITLGGTNIQNRRIYNLGPGGYAGSSWVTADDVRVLDFDGDGKMELMKVDENNTKIYTLNWNGYSMWGELLYDEGFPTKAHRIYMGDFNGDQKTDMLVRNSQTSNSGTWEKAISTGQGFVTTPFLFNRTPDITDDPNDDQLEIGDFNGDGKTDIAHGWNYTQGSEIGMYYSRGDDFAYETMNYGFKLFFKALGQYDFDGDGRADIMNYSQPNLLARTLHFKRGGQELLLQNVVDGHLKRTNFSYRRMTESTNFYSRTSLGGYPQNVVQAPIYLTQQMQQDNGIGGFMTKQYEYVDAYIHRAGKGFLGFREMHTIDLTNDVRTELVRNQTLGIYLLAPYRLKKYVHSTGYLFNQFDYSTSFIARSNECYWLRVNGTTEHLYLEGQTKRMDYTYDTYGNITQEIEDNGVETITTNTTFGQYAGTVPNRPTEATITRQRVGQPAHTFTDRYTYNAKGQLLVRSDYLGLPKQANISFLYNDLGNVIREMRTASGLSLRTIVKSYDSKGRFVVSQVNPMGYTEYATYDPLWGTKTSVTGLDGLTTSFEYDVFGRRTKTTLPTAVVINEIYNFDVNSSYGSIYHHQVNQIGKPDQWFYFDRLGRKVRHHRKSHADAMVYEAWTYDSKGRPKTARAPYKSGESTFTTTYNYDNYNRRISEANPFGTTTYSYSYAGGIAKITKTNPAGQVSTVEMDASGMKTRATDNGGALDYIYDSQGLIHQVKLGGITMVTVLHDVYGNKVRIEDKNSGTLRYDYNAFKELIAETNANGHTYRMTYNKMSQMTRRYGPEEDYRYIYNSSGVERSKLSYVYNILSVYRKDLSYDSFGRVSRTNERIDGPFF
ncbi:MAG: FG-GAP-like repeat-containing protein, partial [Bacteroidota bacterium]